MPGATDLTEQEIRIGVRILARRLRALDGISETQLITAQLFVDVMERAKLSSQEHANMRALFRAVLP